MTQQIKAILAKYSIKAHIEGFSGERVHGEYDVLKADVEAFVAELEAAGFRQGLFYGDFWFVNSYPYTSAIVTFDCRVQEAR